MAGGEQVIYLSNILFYIKLEKNNAVQDLLVNGLEKLALVFPHLGMVYLFDQLGVFVDEPCFPEYIGSCVLYL